MLNKDTDLLLFVRKTGIRTVHTHRRRLTCTTVAIGIVRAAGQVGPLTQAHLSHALVPALDYLQGHPAASDKRTFMVGELPLVSSNTAMRTLCHLMLEQHISQHHLNISMLRSLRVATAL